MVAFELAFATFSTANVVCEKNSRFEIRHSLDALMI